MEYFFIFIFGICIGSFLNVLADRLPNNISPFSGRSKCDFCKKTLSLIDLIPLLSFVWLKAKCRYCHKKLSWQYFLMEIITGFMFVFLYIYQLSTYNSTIIPYSLFFIHYSMMLIIFSSFLVIFISDLKYQIIPDEMLVSALVGVILLGVVSQNSSLIFRMTTGVPYLLSGLGALLFFLIIYLVTKGKGMGFGDVKMSFILGLFLGFPKIIVGLYLAFLTGAGVSIILVLLKKKGLKQTIAFGPFLLIGTVISFFWGNYFWNWYLNFFN